MSGSVVPAAGYGSTPEPGPIDHVSGRMPPPGSKAREFVRPFDDPGLTNAQSDEPVLYVVADRVSAREYTEVSSVKQAASDGEIVAIEARLFGVTISVQETLEHNTECGEDQAQIPTPGGPICINVIQDTLIHSGVLWTEIPDSEDDILLVAGLSSGHLDEPNKGLQGRYRIVGEVVSTKRFDVDLSEGKILIAYEMERTGDIDYEEVGSEARSIIETRSRLVETNLEGQISGPESPAQTPTVSEQESPATPGAAATEETAGAPTETPPEEAEEATATESREATAATEVTGASQPGLGMLSAVLAFLIVIILTIRHVS